MLKGHIRNLKFALLAALMPVMFSISSFTPPESNVNESAVKAMFIYNFAKYFDWSYINQNSDFVIGVYGNSEVTSYLKEIAIRKKINGRSISVRVINSVNEIQSAQIIFIPADGEQALSRISSIQSENPPVLVTEEKGMIKKGAHINLLNIDGNMRFELNETELKNEGLKVAKELSVLAIKLY
jgi:hypothetical protein